MSPRQSERQAQGGAEAQGGQEAVGAVRWLDRPQADDELLGRSLLGFPVPPALPRGLPPPNQRDPEAHDQASGASRDGP